VALGVRVEMRAGRKLWDLSLCVAELAACSCTSTRALKFKPLGRAPRRAAPRTPDIVSASAAAYSSALSAQRAVSKARRPTRSIRSRVTRAPASAGPPRRQGEDGKRRSQPGAVRARARRRRRRRLGLGLKGAPLKPGWEQCGAGPGGPGSFSACAAHALQSCGVLPGPIRRADDAESSNPPPILLPTPAIRPMVPGPPTEDGAAPYNHDVKNINPLQVSNQDGLRGGGW
jgi:hypothetical protein